jgi:hypothetical protein
MREKRNSSKANGVAIDPHRGLVYSDDVCCHLKKFHSKGVRNIYSVVMTYLVKATRRQKVIRLDYGKFHQARGRFLIETGTEEHPTAMTIKEIKLLVSTFNGTKLVNEDVLRKVKYGSRKMKEAYKDRIGEEFY